VGELKTKLNATNSDGETALMLAEEEGDTEQLLQRQ
tara:strand:- start:1385 stop:1492 length:108 start_codon:yes stop_codon:yes gene_type:complete